MSGLFQALTGEIYLEIIHDRAGAMQTQTADGQIEAPVDSSRIKAAGEVEEPDADELQQ